MGTAIRQAMRSFAAWVSLRPYRSIVLAILSIQFLPPVATALFALDALRRGPAAALTAAGLAIAGLAVLGLAMGANVMESVAYAAPILLGGAVLGGVLVRSKSLSLTFQSAVLGFIALTVLLYTLVPGFDRLGEYLIGVMQAGLDWLGATDTQLEQFGQTPGQFLVQALLTMLLLSLLAGLMLGCWWFSLITEDFRFGARFRELRLGHVAGSLLMLVVALPLISSADAIMAAAQLAVIGFLIQGLAVMHARCHSDNWHSAVPVAIYVLFLVAPLNAVVIIGLSIVGLLDNFFSLRAGGKRQD